MPTGSRYGATYGSALYGTDAVPPAPKVTAPAYYGFLYSSALHGALGYPRYEMIVETESSGLPRFEGDALLIPTSEGADLSYVAGDPVRSAGLRNALYLSWFGASAKDRGADNDSEQWWGNYLIDDPVYQYRGQLARLMLELAAVSSNLPVLETAASEDTDWLIELGVASSITTTLSIPSPNRLRVDAEVVYNADVYPVQFTQSWGPIL